MCLTSDQRRPVRTTLSLTTLKDPSRTQKIGEADTAQDAVAMVIERLPANCGPAFNGTPDELMEYEGTQQ